MSFMTATGATANARIFIASGRVAEVIGRTGSYYERDLLTAIASKGREGVYIDVGAHVGNHTAFFALECPSTRVVSLEPCKQLVDCLRKTVARSRISDKVDVLRAAIHNTWRSATAHRTNDNRRIISSDGGNAPCYRIDNLECTDQKIAVIKVDVDGLEANVLLSGERTIKRDHPLLAVEAGTPEVERTIRAVLEPWGYVQGQRYCATPTHIWEWVGG